MQSPANLYSLHNYDSGFWPKFTRSSPITQNLTHENDLLSRSIRPTYIRSTFSQTSSTKKARMKSYTLQTLMLVQKHSKPLFHNYFSLLTIPMWLFWLKTAAIQKAQVLYCLREYILPNVNVLKSSCTTATSCSSTVASLTEQHKR